MKTIDDDNDVDFSGVFVLHRVRNSNTLENTKGKSKVLLFTGGLLELRQGN